MRKLKDNANCICCMAVIVVLGVLSSCFREGGKSFKVAAILPISGPNAAQGIGMMNSCRAAVRDINESGHLGSLKLELMELDDESKPESAVKAAERAAQDQTVLAATAHWNSGPALATAPVFHQYGLANLVPAAINSKITLNQPGDEIFRIDPHDLIIMEYAAEFAARVKGWKKAFIIDDSTQYGKDLATEFSKDYSSRGGTVLGQDSVQVGEKDFAALLTKIKALSPDVVFFGGVVTEGALLRRQMKTVGLDTNLMSLTGIFTQSFIDAAGPAAEGTYSVTVVPPIDLMPGGQDFIKSYDKGHFNQPYEAWGIYGYASIQVLAEAILRSGPTPTRRAVIDELKKGEFDSVLGKMRFDSHGQTTLITMFVYQVEGNKWLPKYRGESNGELKPFTR
jgi:branched-chain amino acid transport system substrate-binding protein